VGSSSSGFVGQAAEHVLPLLQEDSGRIHDDSHSGPMWPGAKPPPDPVWLWWEPGGFSTSEAVILDDPWQSSALRSKDHQIFWVGTYLQRSPAQPSPQTWSATGSHQVSQGFIQVGHKTLHGWMQHGHTELELHLHPNTGGCEGPMSHVCQGQGCWGME